MIDHVARNRFSLICRFFSLIFQFRSFTYIFAAVSTFHDSKKQLLLSRKSHEKAAGRAVYLKDSRKIAGRKREESGRKAGGKQEESKKESQEKWNTFEELNRWPSLIWRYCILSFFFCLRQGWKNKLMIGGSKYVLYNDQGMWLLSIKYNSNTK